MLTDSSLCPGFKIVSVSISKNEFGGEDQIITLAFPDGTRQTFKRILINSDCVGFEIVNNRTKGN